MHATEKDNGNVSVCDHVRESVCEGVNARVRERERMRKTVIAFDIKRT